jgi:hypothetical protein
LWLGWPDHGTIAAKKYTSEFAGRDISGLFGIGQWEGAIWGDREVKFVDEMHEGCEARGVGIDAEIASM